MPVIICLLRGVNIGGHHKIKMDVLRGICESLDFKDVQTLLQSGNVAFRARERNLPRISTQIQDGIERKAGFRPDVIVRTLPELRDVIARNPFAKRRGIESNKFGVGFLGGLPTNEARESLLKLKIAPEEVHLDGRELYVYFTNGMARPSFSPSVIERALKTSSTMRNWNTVTKLLELAEKLGQNP
ncbi:MAG TPA: DUF1697 domain-containing protein [Candidatus Limnocylindrales bacterium]|nr:DUF1697 domain-containing protein [Candidatus Limnocylindrales bacterium]